MLMGYVWNRSRQMPHHHDFNLSSENDIWLAKMIVPTSNESCELYHNQKMCLVTFHFLSLSFFHPFLCSPDNRKKLSSDSPSLLQGAEQSVIWFLCSVYLGSLLTSWCQFVCVCTSCVLCVPAFVPRHIPACS